MEKDNIEIKEEIKVSKRFKKVQKNKSFGKIVQSINNEEFEISENSLINEENVNTKNATVDLGSCDKRDIQSNNIEKEEKNSNFFEINNDSGYNINKSIIKKNIDEEETLFNKDVFEDATEKKVSESQKQMLDVENTINEKYVDSKYSLLKELEFDSFLKTQDSTLIKNDDYEYNDVSFIKSLEEKYKIDLNDSNKERGYSYNIEKDNKSDIENKISNDSGDTLKSRNNNKTDIENTDKSKNNLSFENTFLNKDSSKNDLLESKSSFDIGNILYRDYNDKTKNSISPVDALEEKEEYSNENNHSNEYRDFYDIHINEMPNRENLLKELYEDEYEDEYNRTKGATAKKGVEKNRVKGSNVLDKIFKRRV